MIELVRHVAAAVVVALVLIAAGSCYVTGGGYGPISADSPWADSDCWPYTCATDLASFRGCIVIESGGTLPRSYFTGHFEIEDFTCQLVQETKTGG